ncbi:MAG TPA: hypothetical protein VMT04_09095 [Terriglobales bacterium]|nr:hypothetical protein [Terriglobales bacterium]
MFKKIRQVVWIFLVDTYVLILSFALLKVIELMLRSSWAHEPRLLKLLDIAFTLPILLVYIFLLSFDLSEFFFRKGAGEELNG